MLDTHPAAHRLAVVRSDRVSEQDVVCFDEKVF